MDTRKTKVKDKYLKHMGELSLKIETITKEVEQQILEHKKVNIHSAAITPEEASYNRGAVDALTKVSKMLRKECKDFA